jgi:hypothetical protein
VEVYLRKVLASALDGVSGQPSIFFSGEGPRSRRYGRTAALRLIVQPYDENDYFLSFS